MAATTKNINTAEKPCAAVDFEYTVNSSATLYVGAMANMNSSGELVDAGDTASQVCVGNVQFYDSTTKKAIVRRGIFKYLINSTNLTDADVGTNATVKDNQTLSKASVTTNDVSAGRIVKVESDGVWVDHRTA